MDSKQFLEVVEKYKAGFITLPDVMESLAVYTFGEVEKHGEQIAREIEICEPCFNDVWCGKDEKNQDCSCICHQYAAIARGEKELK